MKTGFHAPPPAPPGPIYLNNAREFPLPSPRPFIYFWSSLANPAAPAAYGSQLLISTSSAEIRRRGISPPFSLAAARTLNAARMHPGCVKYLLIACLPSFGDEKKGEGGGRMRALLNSDKHRDLLLFVVFDELRELRVMYLRKI